jgi:hypothetical protein
LGIEEKEKIVMATRVMPLHFVTVTYRLYPESEDSQTPQTAGQHRFLYGVESWIEGVDQQLESLAEGELLELLLTPEAAAVVSCQLVGQEKSSGTEVDHVLELRVVEVAKAEPKEVVEALAASVKCCDHCGSH